MKKNNFQSKICLPVIGNTLEEFLTNLNHVQKISQLIELRVDKITHLSEKDLEIIRKQTKKKAIIKVNNNQSLIKKALNLNFDLIDVDIEIFKNLKISLPKNRLIISYHNFDQTPSDFKLENIFHSLYQFKPYIIKIATMVNHPTDIARLVFLMVKKPLQQKRVIIGMGEKGKITRIIGLMMGNYLSYASSQFGHSAIGQIDFFKMKKIFQLIK